MQGVLLKQTRVGANGITLGQHQHIAAQQLGTRHAARAAARLYAAPPQHCRSGCRHPGARRHHVVRLRLLHQADHAPLSGTMAAITITSTSQPAPRSTRHATSATTTAASTR